MAYEPQQNHLTPNAPMIMTKVYIISSGQAYYQAIEKEHRKLFGKH